MKHCFLFFVAIVFCTYSAGAQTPSYGSVSFFHSANGIANLLDPESMTVDPWRGEFYVASASQPRITVVRAYEHDPHRTLGTDGSLAAPVRIVGFEPYTRRLLITDRDAFPRMANLSAYDISASSIAAQTGLGPCERIDVVSDADRHRLYVSTGREHILILDAGSLAIVDSIGFGALCGGLAFDSTNAELYCAQAMPVHGISVVKKYNVLNNENIRTISIATNEPVDHVVVSPRSGGCMAYGEGEIRFFDAFGLSMYERAIQGQVAAVAVSRMFQCAYIANVRGPRLQGNAGYSGRVHSAHFIQAHLDSMEFSYPAVAVAVHETSSTLAVLTQEDATLYLLNIPDMAPQGDVSLGKRVESAAAVSNTMPLCIGAANPAGGKRQFIYRYTSEQIDEWDAGQKVCAVREYEKTKGFAVLSQASATVSVYDSVGLSAGTFKAEGYEGVSTWFPGMATASDQSGEILLTFPEYMTYVFIDPEVGSVSFADFVDGFYTMGEPGHGAIQPCFVPGGEYYCILLHADRMLNVYSRQTKSIVRTIDLAELDWDAVAPFGAWCLQSGQNDGSVYVGSYRIDVTGSEPPSRIAPDHAQCLAERNNGKTLILLWESGSLYAARTEAGVPVVEDQWYLGSDMPNDITVTGDGYTAVCASNNDANVYYIADYTVEGVSTIPLPENPACVIYPNPLLVSQQRTVTIATEDIAREHAVLTFHTVAGQELARIQTDIHNGSAVISLPMQLRTSGMYFVTVQGETEQRSAILMVL